MRDALGRRQQHQHERTYIGSEAVALVQPQPAAFFGSEALWECKLVDLDVEPQLQQQQKQEAGRGRQRQLQKGSWDADVAELEKLVPSKFVLLTEESMEDMAPDGAVELSSTEVPAVLVVQVLNGQG